MASPQKEDGYTAIANEIMEALSRYRIPGEQMQCLLFILRKTYGFNKKWDAISNSQFTKATGLDKSSVCRAINGLIDKNIVDKNVNPLIPRYQFNKNYKKWKVLTKKSTVDKKVNDRLQKSQQVLTKKSPTKDIPKETITKDIPPKKLVTKKSLKKDMSDFDLFWEAYPYKVRKQDSIKIWLNPKKKKGRPSIKELIEILEIQKISINWTEQDGKFIPHPPTWLNQARWDDELRMPREGGDHLKPTTYAQAQDAERRVTARWLLREMKRDKQKGSDEGTGQDVPLLPDGQVHG